MLKIEEVRHDLANGVTVIYAVRREGGGVFYVRISATAKAEAKPSPEERITDWLKQNSLPEGGATIKIPDDHFHYF